MRGLEGKVAVVVGGGGGIGAASARRLAEHGVAVAIGDVDRAGAERVAADIEATGGDALPLAVDVTDDGDVARLMDAAVERFGRLDLLHANAADTEVLRQDTDAVDVDLEVFDRTIDVNLKGYLRCTRHALPHLLERGGTILYTTSGAAFVGEPERVCYAMSKGGINALMRHVASRWGRKGVRANAIAPGLVLTEKVRAQLPEEFHELVRAQMPSVRLGEPEDIAAMVAYLASDDAAWINGQVISVDGGATMR